jgi:hypothetical protein
MMLTKLFALFTHENAVHPVSTHLSPHDATDTYERDPQMALSNHKTLRMFPC